MPADLRKISVVGLGYVGLPVAVAFGQEARTIAFDKNEHRVQTLQAGEDWTGEVTPEELRKSDLLLTTDAAALKQADFHIIAVPTPIDANNKPDLSIIESASRTVGEQLKAGDIVVYESTVYPGVTEEVCIPLLEQTSGLKCGRDFTVGYSPERINPGDKEHTFTKILKIVSGQDQATLDIIADTYSRVVTAGVYKAQSIKVAEAAKVIENTQRDINIALMNELAMIFNKLGIDTHAVLAAAGTKWNFLKFSPGLVGGHCIGVDPYYLTYRADQVGIHPKVILAGRSTNDGMGQFIAEQTVLQLQKQGINAKDAEIGILGITFKENCNDIRNSKVIDIINTLKSFQCDIKVSDPEAIPDQVKREYGLTLTAFDQLKDLDAVIIAVAHNAYKALKPASLENILTDKGVVIDVKNLLEADTQFNHDILLWRL